MSVINWVNQVMWIWKICTKVYDCTALYFYHFFINTFHSLCWGLWCHMAPFNLITIALGYGLFPRRFLNRCWLIIVTYTVTNCNKITTFFIHTNPLLLIKFGHMFRPQYIKVTSFQEHSSLFCRRMQQFPAVTLSSSSRQAHFVVFRKQTL